MTSVRTHEPRTLGVHEVYDRLADEYDARIETETVLDQHFVRTELEFVLQRVEPGARVIDLGCGTGRISLPLAQAGARVTGVDLSTNMLDRARAKAADKGVTIDFRESDLLHLPFDDGSFDMASAALALMHVPITQRPALFSEVARVLKPGGQFVFSAKNSLFERITPVDRFVSADRTSPHLQEMTFTGTTDGIEYTTPWCSFSPEDLTRLGCLAGMDVIAVKGNLSISAWLADAVLADPRVSAVVCALEAMLGDVPPFSHLGYYLLVEMMTRPGSISG